MILVDTSIWIDHFRRCNKKLVTLLLNDMVLIHPFIIGELACGSLKKRSETINLLSKISMAEKGSDEEILIYLEKQKLYSRGLSLIDVHLLAAAQLSNAKLWSLDKKLTKSASQLKINFD